MDRRQWRKAQRPPLPMEKGESFEICKNGDLQVSGKYEDESEIGRAHV